MSRIDDFYKTFGDEKVQRREADRVLGKMAEDLNVRNDIHRHGKSLAPYYPQQMLTLTGAKDLGELRAMADKHGKPTRLGLEYMMRHPEHMAIAPYTRVIRLGEAEFDTNAPVGTIGGVTKGLNHGNGKRSIGVGVFDSYSGPHGRSQESLDKEYGQTLMHELNHVGQKLSDDDVNRFLERFGVWNDEMQDGLFQEPMTRVADAKAGYVHDSERDVYESHVMPTVLRMKERGHPAPYRIRGSEMAQLDAMEAIERSYDQDAKQKLGEWYGVGLEQPALVPKAPYRF